VPSDALKRNLSSCRMKSSPSALVLGQRRQSWNAFAFTAGDGIYGYACAFMVTTTLDGSCVSKRYIILGFAGSRAIAREWRAKQSPLRDVAECSDLQLRRLCDVDDYAADVVKASPPWAVGATCGAIDGGGVSSAYRETTVGAEFLPSDRKIFKTARVVLAGQSAAQLLYELNNRPAWVRAPLMEFCRFRYSSDGGKVPFNLETRNGGTGYIHNRPTDLERNRCCRTSSSPPCWEHGRRNCAAGGKRARGAREASSPCGLVSLTPIPRRATAAEWGPIGTRREPHLLSYPPVAPPTPALTAREHRRAYRAVFAAVKAWRTRIRK